MQNNTRIHSFRDVCCLPNAVGPLHCLQTRSEANCVEFSPTGTLLAVGSDDPEIQLWSVVAPLEVRLIWLPA